ncbi:MAG: hypothetical protein ACRDJ1_02840, partial [Actinomycetota bacterium]
MTTITAHRAFAEELDAIDVRALARRSMGATDADVTRALARGAGERDLDDLAALLSPAAGAR